MDVERGFLEIVSLIQPREMYPPDQRVFVSNHAHRMDPGRRDRADNMSIRSDLVRGGRWDPGQSCTIASIYRLFFLYPIHLRQQAEKGAL